MEKENEFLNEPLKIPNVEEKSDTNEKFEDFKIIWSGNKLPFKLKLKLFRFNIKKWIIRLIDRIKYGKKYNELLNIIATDQDGNYYLYENCYPTKVQRVSETPNDNMVVEVEFSYGDSRIGNINEDLVDKIIEQIEDRKEK